jgi:hypothetical protein
MPDEIVPARVSIPAELESEFDIVKRGLKAVLTGSEGATDEAVKAYLVGVLRGKSKEVVEEMISGAIYVMTDHDTTFVSKGFYIMAAANALIVDVLIRLLFPTDVSVGDGVDKAKREVQGLLP